MDEIDDQSDFLFIPKVRAFLPKILVAVVVRIF